MLKRILTFTFALLLVSITAFAQTSTPQQAKLNFDDARLAYFNKNWPQALKLLKPFADVGHGEAMVLLGRMYQAGNGVPQNFREALMYYRRAATERNNTLAMNALGDICLAGVGMPRNISCGKEWYSRSAKLGNGTGAFVYASILSRSIVNPPAELQADFYEAYKWYLIGANSDPRTSDYRGASDGMAKALRDLKLKPAEARKGAEEAKAFKPTTPSSLGPPPVYPDVKDIQFTTAPTPKTKK